VFLHSLDPDDSDTHYGGVFNGRCFNSISVQAFVDRNEARDLTMHVNLNLDDKIGLACVEHLQFSSSFTDHYDFYMRAGTHTVELSFTDPEEIADIKMSGLNLFNYCADSLEMITSAFMTSLLWVGGSGHSQYVPILGNKPTGYQNTNNRIMFQQFTGDWLQERVIKKVPIVRDYSDLMGTGDVLVSRRWTGYAAEMMLLSGSHASNVAIVVERHG